MPSGRTISGNTTAAAKTANPHAASIHGHRRRVSFGFVSVIGLTQQQAAKVSFTAWVGGDGKVVV
ncbi:MAG: hypothetical protein RLZZ350_109 [Verrucomicrobiota bacterium]